MEFYVGQCAEFTKTFNENDVYIFAGISGDFNPIHIDVAVAKDSIFGNRVIHGAFVNALVSTALGMYLPGEGTIYLSQNSHFKRAVFIGDTVTVKVKINEIDKRNRARLSTDVFNQRDEIVLEGMAYVSLPKTYNRVGANIGEK